MTIPEMEGVLAIADSYPLRDRLLVHLMYSAGLRVGEVVALRWVDIDCDSDIVMVHGKGGTQRRVPIGSDISRIAMQYRMTMSTVSVTNRVFSLSRRHVQTLIKVMCRAAGLSNSWSAHSLRHSAATHLLAGGGTIRDAQAFLGHQQLSTTQIYTHLVPTQLRDSLKKAHPRY
jgi:integrase/recombinase XerD